MSAATRVAAADAHGDPASQPTVSFASLDVHGDPAWLAQSSGFKVGEIVTRTPGGGPEAMYTIFEIDSAIVVKLKQVCRLSGTNEGTRRRIKHLPAIEQLLWLER